MRARRFGVRACFCVANLGVVASLIVGGAMLVAPAVDAKKAAKDGLLPPGQAKRVAGDRSGQVGGTGSTPRPPKAESPKAAKAPVSEAPKTAKAKVKVKVPKAAKSPKADNPVESQQPGREAAQPSVATPSQVSAASPTTPPVAPATPATSPEALSGDAGPRTTTAEPRRGKAEPTSKKAAKPTASAARLPDSSGIRDGSMARALDVAASRPATERRDEPVDEQSSPVVRTVRDIVEIVPAWMKLAIAALAALSLLLAGGYAFSLLRARSLARQRGELLSEVGLLQTALLPPVPAELAGLRTSVSYRPADGPAAGGDFYDALPLPGGRAAFVLGDLSGHGRQALERTAFMRYTLRAYLEAGLEPRVALQVAGRVIGDGLDGDFATVLLAVHDPHQGALTFASAGHPAPIVVGGTPFEPVVAGSSPPIGIGERTGLRQTTVPLVPRSVACLYTDGLIEARTADGGLLGRERLEQIVAQLGHEASAPELLERVASEALATPDDMATCLLTPLAGVTSGGFRTEQLELSADEVDGPLLGRFLDECGVPEETRVSVIHDAEQTSERFGGALVSVVFGNRRSVEVLPRNVESLEAVARRAA